MKQIENPQAVIEQVAKLGKLTDQILMANISVTFKNLSNDCLKELASEYGRTINKPTTFIPCNWFQIVINESLNVSFEGAVLTEVITFE